MSKTEPHFLSFLLALTFILFVISLAESIPVGNNSISLLPFAAGYFLIAATAAGFSHYIGCTGANDPLLNIIKQAAWKHEVIYGDLSNLFVLLVRLTMSSVICSI